MITFLSLLTTFKASAVFWGSWCSIKMGSTLVPYENLTKLSFSKSVKRSVATIRVHNTPEKEKG